MYKVTSTEKEIIENVFVWHGGYLLKIISLCTTTTATVNNYLLTASLLLSQIKAANWKK